MDTAAKAQLEKIKKYSKSLQRLMQFFMVVMLIGGILTAIILISWNAPSRPETAVARIIDLNGLRFEWTVAPAAVKALTAAYLTSVFVCVCLIAHNMARLFALYARGTIFTEAHVRAIRTVGILLCVVSLTWIITVPMRLMLGTGVDPAVSEAAADSAMAIRTDNLSPFFCGLIVIFISWVMDVGRRLREEHDLVV